MVITSLLIKPITLSQHPLNVINVHKILIKVYRIIYLDFSTECKKRMPQWPSPRPSAHLTHSLTFPCSRCNKQIRGAQWLSGRVLDSRPRGRGFEPHRRHCVVSLSKNIHPSLVLVQPRKTRPFITERLLMGR